MSFWTGIERWFTKRPYKNFIMEWSKLVKESPRLLKDINLPVGKYRFSKELDRLWTLANELNGRRRKLSDEHKRFILVRNRDAANRFFPLSGALIQTFQAIFKILRKKTITRRDLIGIETYLKRLKPNILKLRKATLEISNSLLPIKFNRISAIDPYNAFGTTTDGISISSIIKVARGFGFKVRRGGRHVYTIDLIDGQQPCALGESTSYARHVRNRLAFATNRGPREIDSILVRV